MEKLKIKTESLPQRCEICHQSDLFDAERNHCERCSANVPVPSQRCHSCASGLDQPYDYCPHCGVRNPVQNAPAAPASGKLDRSVYIDRRLTLTDKVLAAVIIALVILFKIFITLPSILLPVMYILCILIAAYLIYLLFTGGRQY